MAEKTQDLQVDTHPLNEIRRTIAVLSGKGGVGKSLITALLATYLQRSGKYRVGVLDADVTGPSIPKMFGADKFKPRGSDEGLFPVHTHSNIQLMSINLLLEDPTAPVIWRGPILANTVKQFWRDVIWGDLDFLLIDMPPGTGDIPLTVFQSLPIDGLVIVTSPQDLVSLIVSKAIHMAQMMKIPIVGLVENMSYTTCPHCGQRINLFGIGHSKQAAQEAGIPFLGALPIDPELATLSDRGQIERFHKPYLQSCLEALEKIPSRYQTFKVPDLTPADDEKEILSDESDTRKQSDDSGGSMKKIAIASDNQVVSAHFGHCEGFTLFTVSDGSDEFEKQYLPNPGHKPGFLPNYLNEQGVTVIIAGGMGSGAVEIFQEKGIDVITGAEGDVDQVIRSYIDGTLQASGAVCHEHSHSGD